MSDEVTKRAVYYKIQAYYGGLNLYIKIENGHRYYTRFANENKWYYSAETFEVFREKWIEMTAKEVFLEIL